MSFSERAKTIALAIVKIFETSKPFGRYDAVAVLDDGAGISYGTSQFTHKSGSLHAVLQRFAKLGGTLPSVVQNAMADFEKRVRILARSNEKPLKQALAKLGGDPLMQRAQREIAFENYLKKALDACEGSGFVFPLSLAVIYDSINHGSYERIRDRVQLQLPASIKPEEYEKEWITQYVQKRDAWLESVPRLAKTDYRTDFFLAQIARGNWNLKLPMNVHGFQLTEEILFPHGVPEVSAVASTTPTDIPDKGFNDSAVNASEQSPISSETRTTEIVEDSGKTVAVEQSVTTAKGDLPSVAPVRVSQNGPLSKWLAGGGLMAVGTFAWNYIQSNPSAVAIGILCATALIVAIIFRGAITDAVRMTAASDPDKKNVT